MSTCISPHGEYGAHDPYGPNDLAGPPFECSRCHLFDEDAALRKIAELEDAAVNVTDPTSEPDPRRWGSVIHGEHAGSRVYWDASLHARHENAWISLDRQHRFSADMVRGDADVSEPGLREQVTGLGFTLRRLALRVESLEKETRDLSRLRTRVAELEAKVGQPEP